MVRISAWGALLFGVFLACAEAYRNWENWQWWPFWLVDYMAASLLIYGAYIALRRANKTCLAAGWAFTSAMFWMSLFDHIANKVEHASRTYGPNQLLTEDSLTQIITIMTLISFAGLIGTLTGKVSPES